MSEIALNSWKGDTHRGRKLKQPGRGGRRWKAAAWGGGSAGKAESENGNWFAHHHSISLLKRLMKIPLQVCIKGAELQQASWKGVKEKGSIRESRRAPEPKKSIDFEFFISHVNLKSNYIPIVALSFCIFLHNPFQITTFSCWMCYLRTGSQCCAPNLSFLLWKLKVVPDPK